MIDKKRDDFDISSIGDMSIVFLRIAIRIIIVLEILSIITAGIFAIEQVVFPNEKQVILGLLPTIKLVLAGIALFVYSKKHYKRILSNNTGKKVKSLKKILAAYLLILSLLIASVQQWFVLLLDMQKTTIFTGNFVILSVPFIILIEDKKIIKNFSIIEISLAFIDFSTYIILQEETPKHTVLLVWFSQIILYIIVASATYMVKYFMLKIIRGYEAKLNTTESYRNIAETDALTGLSNRRALDIDTSIISQLGSKKISIAMFDIDKFKRFNDDYGHQIGDYVLSSVGKLARTIGNMDLCEAYRYGGEEILIIFLDRNSSEVVKQIELFRSAVANIKIPGAENTHITISAGLISSEMPDLAAMSLSEENMFNAGSAIILNLIQKADTNLYIAKNTGRNKLVTGYTTLTAGQKKKVR